VLNNDVHAAIQSLIGTGIFSCGVLALALLETYRQRKLRIVRFARAATRGCRSERAAAFALARVIFAGVQRGPDPVFITRMLVPLGASPAAVLDEGGCCSGIHRLFIACLDAIGIRSAQITLYSQGPRAVHCLAQVETAAARIIIDVDYGVWLKHPGGGAIGLADLQAGVSPTIEPFELHSQAHSVGEAEPPRPAGYPAHGYYQFDFSLTRTANWTKNSIRRSIYRALHRLTAGRVDCLLLPPILEWPEVLLAAAVTAVALAGATAYALI